jgi:hypothetical protein
MREHVCACSLSWLLEVVRFEKVQLDAGAPLRQVRAHDDHAEAQQPDGDEVPYPRPSVPNPDLVAQAAAMPSNTFRATKDVLIAHH